MGKIKNILFKERLEGYLSVFNQWKLKWTGIKSRYTIRNQDILKAWNESVEGMSSDDIDHMAVSIKKAMYAACESDWHKESNYRWITPHFFLREDKREHWLGEYTANIHIKKHKPFNRERYV